MKKKNELEKDTKAKGAAQELDMNALENVAGGQVKYRPGARILAGSYDVIDDKTGEVVKTFDASGFRMVRANIEALKFDKKLNGDTPAPTK